MICHHITIPPYRKRVTIPKSPGFPAFAVGPDGQDIRTTLTDGITIYPAEGTSGIEDLFNALLDVWEEDSPGVEPVLVYADFGDVAPEGFAALVPSEEGWATLRAFNVRKVESSELEERMLTPLQQAQEERDYWKVCCQEVDAICDDYDIPQHGEDGSVLRTEERVRLLVLNHVVRLSELGD